MSIERDLARRRAKAKAKLTEKLRAEVRERAIAAARSGLGCTCNPEVSVTIEVDDWRRRSAAKFMDRLTDAGVAVLALDTPPEVSDYEEGMVVNIAHDDGCPALEAWGDRGPVAFRPGDA